MNEVLAMIALLLAGTSGFVALLFGSRRSSDRLFAVLLSIAAILGQTSAVRALIGCSSPPWIGNWPVPAGAFHIEVDALSGLFLASIFLLGAIGACYGSEYFGVAEQGRRAIRLRIYYGLVVAGMALVVISKNSILFLVGWEIMALCAFMALTVEDQHQPVRDAGLVYLIATRVGTLAIIATFALLSVQGKTYSLALRDLPSSSPLASATFVLALLGFGLKAGMMPLHVWLPAAHANAPSHVSALMSGVLIKMGIYGLLRITSFYRDVPLWWGMMLLGLALISSVMGVAFALGQHDIKRLLAYHSVENIGIILLGIAVGLIGRACAQPALVAMGYAGALLHVLNHGLFKSLLFLGAGSIISATGTRDLEQLGGLSKKMPRTAFTFLIGAIAIAGLPPLNGFVSELFIYLGMLEAQWMAVRLPAIALAFAVPLLAMVGALALACFVKVCAVVFLGEPRSPRTAQAQECPSLMWLPMVLLACCCVTIGAFPAVALGLLRAPISIAAAQTAKNAFPNVTWLGPVHWALLGFFMLLWGILRNRPEATQPTWDCGYVAPTARMQCTASSISGELVGMFAVLLRPSFMGAKVIGILPKSSAFSSHVPEVVLDSLIYPSLRAVSRGIGYLRFIQSATAHVYLFYVLLTLLVMLAVFR